MFLNFLVVYKTDPISVSYSQTDVSCQLLHYIQSKKTTMGTVGVVLLTTVLMVWIDRWTLTQAAGVPVPYSGKREMSEAAVDLINRLQSSSSPSPSDKKKFAELSPDDMETVILHVQMDIAEKLVIEIPNNQIDQVLTILIMCFTNDVRFFSGKFLDLNGTSD